MSATYIIYNIVPYGFILLLSYIFIDIFLDYFRKSKSSNINRILLYSFLFYLLSLIQIKFGGISFPLIDPAYSYKTFIFEETWFSVFNTIHSYINTWSYSGVFYNLVILIPLGIYFSVLFDLKSNLKAVTIVALTCIGIEIIHLLFGKMGMVLGSMNCLMIIISLFINIIGGTVGFLLAVHTLKRWNSFKNTGEVKLVN